MKKAICYGEILWDNLPAGKQPGGAPMNVAYHLNQLGIAATLISKLGNDADGEELRDFLEYKQMPAHLIQKDLTYPTSNVNVMIDKDEEMTYDIVYPVAWDNILWSSHYETEVAAADTFVFGSLAARDKVSKQTLLQLLNQANFTVFDVNLRPPHYTAATIEELLSKTNLLKLNIAELELLGNLYTHFNQTDDVVCSLQDRFNIAEVLLTKGINGCSYYSEAIKLEETIYEVKVADTVGSGDSFLAAFLAKKLQNEPIGDCLSFATALSAFVTSKKGACPTYVIKDIEDFRRTANKRMP